MILKQNADLTFKYNIKKGRYGWLRLTPAYSVKIVETILSRFSNDINILEPFSGTATTGLASGYHNFKATCIDINPFLIWFGNAKTRIYTDNELENTKKYFQEIICRYKLKQPSNNHLPNMSNIERWWTPTRLRDISHLKVCIDTIISENSKEKDLILIAFCKVLITLSNADFGHQSVSLKKNNDQISLFEIDEIITTFDYEIRCIIDSAKENPSKEPDIILCDSINMTLNTKKFNLIITSPPYPNRMSYIRELRPYMYWLNFFNEAKEAGELDCKCIGGTWGIATSRLNEWELNKDAFIPKYLFDIVSAIKKSNNKHSIVLANYVCKYFENMWFHLLNMQKLLYSKAEVHYIIGNSVFYNIIVPSEKIFADMFSELGFVKIEIVPIRKRNSKKELIEFDVIAFKK